VEDCVQYFSKRSGVLNIPLILKQLWQRFIYPLVQAAPSKTTSWTKQSLLRLQSQVAATLRYSPLWFGGRTYSHWSLLHWFADLFYSICVVL